VRKITNVVIHSSDSAWGSADVIRKWHTDPKPQGNGWKTPGYHYVILNTFPTYDNWRRRTAIRENDGVVESLVPLDQDDWLEPDEIANHAYGYNQFSIGICCISKHGLFTWKQIKSLQETCWTILQRHETLHSNSFLGHYETTTGRAQGKTCPGFDMNDLREYLMNRIRLKNANR